MVISRTVGLHVHIHVLYTIPSGYKIKSIVYIYIYIPTLSQVLMYLLDQLQLSVINFGCLCSVSLRCLQYNNDIVLSYSIEVT